jgi:hypothetical protein
MNLNTKNMGIAITFLSCVMLSKAENSLTPPNKTTISIASSMLEASETAGKSFLCPTQYLLTDFAKVMEAVSQGAMYKNALVQYTAATITAIDAAFRAFYYKAVTKEDAQKIGKETALNSLQSFWTPVVSVFLIGFIALRIIKGIIRTCKENKETKVVQLS